ncbi:SFRS1 [Lepeophtheirus salmonis]|uniref:SFRS1 n=1 Tax=Lepeophtheirus salmonis TaxID=72036 RepID=A0A7R8CLD6_LEPSM|nr:SFRS1 [Lepeophtheirus salmonis]CAF2854584.1 SFRS1 [Lepeophtheirus salmonis]
MSRETRIYYGKIVFIDLKNRRGPPFAFVEFEDHRDADDAVYARDGVLPGAKWRQRGTVRVEEAAETEDGIGGLPRDDPQFRVVVSGLPPSGSWQDLKDHMREAGDVCFADVYKDGTGACEYLRYEDMKYAIKKLNDTKFKCSRGDFFIHGETSYVRIKEDYGGGDRSRSRSRSRSRTPKRRRGSPTYSPVHRERSFSNSRSRRIVFGYTKSIIRNVHKESFTPGLRTGFLGDIN